MGSRRAGPLKELERRKAEKSDTQHLVNLSGYLWAQGVLGEHGRGRVLEIASGTGYGADFIASSAKRVIAGDNDLLTLQGSKAEYSRENLAFVLLRGEQLPFKAGLFQSVVSLETLEHIPDDRGFLSELYRVLVPKGLLALSTPFREEHCDRPENPYHVREYSVDSLTALLDPFFEIIRLLGRHPGPQMASSEKCLDGLRRYDCFSLRRIFPRSFRHGLANVWLRMSGRTALHELRPQDVEYTEDLTGAVSLALLCRKRP